MPSDWTEDPRPPIGALRTQTERRIVCSSGRWYLAVRRRSTIGPFPSAHAAMAASDELATRLHGVDEQTAEGIIESFASKWVS